eukprot:4396392-Pyramimonas_sp.AAC.1
MNSRWWRSFAEILKHLARGRMRFPNPCSSDAWTIRAFPGPHPVRGPSFRAGVAIAMWLGRTWHITCGSYPFLAYSVSSHPRAFGPYCRCSGRARRTVRSQCLTSAAR